MAGTAVPSAHALDAISEAAIKNAAILVVDDHPPNVLALESVLGVSGFASVASTTDSSETVSLCASLQPDLLLLDLHMPAPDGFEVLELLAPWVYASLPLPILVLTADDSREAKQRALGLGASDFVNKPFDPSEVVLRIRNLVRTRLLQLRLRDQNDALERRVRERTRDLEEARTEAIEHLALAAEYRDDATGGHAQRIGRTSGRIAAELELPEETVELIQRAAPLHDIGKLGISDTLLLKPDTFTPEETEVMRLHVSIGSEILGRSRSALLQTAEEIARTHHERWDGTGYLAGLKGEQIPISGRIVAVADVFDALTHKRPYRAPKPPAEALAEIRRQSGHRFDPRVVDAFTACLAELLASPTLKLVA